ncbi:MAG: HlyC/CorC family transporter [Chloroflexi bacterium]|jgi:CBS domain containing-hemolysin-like protein|nr:HlyC/CorC family transporter [Chloroflexota bacterium]MBT3669946.1 HlyC/CorC family transporter [Chloroflexota bacterium]MBT4001853.1 HlyC/CorC family transporter [Chloroflexota bacterium]MBT4304848.1 HlyC/CorC family transporter [Chloroflexota bacterium]MBT4534651.1 HlyC/CorC family transporter [Chloroflexota bacterium]
MDIFLPILIIAILVLLNGLFVAAEFAIVAAPKTRITQLADRGSKVALTVLKILNNPQKQNEYITTAQVGITIASLGLGMYGETVIASWIFDLFHSLEIDSISSAATHTIATVISVGLLTYVHVVIGEMIPKSLALQNAEQTVMALHPPMSFTEKIFTPIVWLLNKFSNAITKLLGIPEASKSSLLFTSAELEYLVDESSESGMLEPSDQLFIQNILDLEERTVAQAMTPRNRFDSIPSTVSRKDALDLVCQTTKTRYPVYEESIDQIIGILHIKDLARNLVHHGDGENFKIKDILRPAIFVPETLALDELLIRFRSGSHQIAVVFGEFGGTTGLITLEDLVEEVVGEIQDEFDQEEILPIVEVSPTLLRVRGDVILEELHQLYDLDLIIVESHTIGGLVMTLLGRIPQAGDEVEYKGVKIKVGKVENRAVISVLLDIENKI